MLTDVVDDPPIRRCGRAQDRHRRRQPVEDPGDPAVVRTEVVAPIGDAVGLIDYEQPGRGHDERQKVSAEVGVAQALWGNEEEVEETLPKLLLHLRPLLGVVAVDASGVHADSSGHLALVAHQGQQRGDQQSRARPSLPEQSRGDEVDGAFSPAGPLHDQGSPSLGNDGLDGLELARSERCGGVSGHRPKWRQRRGREGR